MLPCRKQEKQASVEISEALSILYRKQATFLGCVKKSNTVNRTRKFGLNKIRKNEQGFLNTQSLILLMKYDLINAVTTTKEGRRGWDLWTCRRSYS
jgi:hypothetical protein